MWPRKAKCSPHQRHHAPIKAQCSFVIRHMTDLLSPSKQGILTRTFARMLTGTVSGQHTQALSANPSALCQSQHPGQDLAGWWAYKAAGSVYTTIWQEFVGWRLHWKLTFSLDTILGSRTVSGGTVRLQGQSSLHEAASVQPERQVSNWSFFFSPLTWRSQTHSKQKPSTSEGRAYMPRQLAWQNTWKQFHSLQG